MNLSVFRYDYKNYQTFFLCICCQIPAYIPARRCSQRSIPQTATFEGRRTLNQNLH